MLTCKEITELATEAAEGALDPATARRFEQHLAGCAGCRTWVAQLGAAARVLRSLPAPEVPPDLAASLLRRFDERRAGRAPSPAPPAPLAGGAAWPRRLAPLALAAASAAIAGLAHRPSHHGGDWALGLALALAAMALAALVRRLTLGFAALAASAALAAALVRGGEGGHDLAAGAECLVVLFSMAGGAALLAWRLARGDAGRSSRASAGVWAVAGALAGDAALQVACAQHQSLPHLLAFHVGGLLAVAAVSWLLTGRRLPAG